MDNDMIARVIKRNAGTFLAFKLSDANVAVRKLFESLSTADIEFTLGNCTSVTAGEFSAFIHAGEKLSAHQMTALMSAVNYRLTVQKVECGELNRIAPERLVLQVQAMQELNILNNMRANTAEDKLADAKAANAADSQ